MIEINIDGLLDSENSVTEENVVPNVYSEEDSEGIHQRVVKIRNENEKQSSGPFKSNLKTTNLSRLKSNLIGLEEHLHVQNSKKRGIDEGVKEMIRELYNFGLTGSMKIIYALRDKIVDKEKIPSRRQIYIFLYELKHELFGPATITYSELKNWCPNNELVSF
ncbi:unnamed protein product [Brachionus calyciflorus]|uniref:Uncharacterized protein n=1 Tax=Brachionus calyciflorus TaxID=104777 RepID=A0A814QMA5_9BILA|nr:unnamed protein product [Brachionus calyciflorus]